MDGIAAKVERQMFPLKLFYSWQMDRPTRVCRDFVRKALIEAAAILQMDGIALTVESGAEGVPGTPAMTETILGKIRDCDLFLADMTFVAEAGGKMIPNPNVMGEYGYALHSKGNRRILLTMNTAYGPPEALPFDLHHLRHPEGYDVGEAVTDGPRRKARTLLGRRLADYIKAIAADVRSEVARTELEQREALKARWWDAVQQRATNDRPTLVSVPSALIHVVPMMALTSQDLGPRQVKGPSRLLKLYDGAATGADGHQWWAHGQGRAVAEGSNPEATWYGRILQPGLLEWEVTFAQRIGSDPTTVVDGTHLEALIVEVADRGLELSRELDLGGPFLIGIVLYGTQDLEVTGRRRIGRFRQPSLVLPAAMVPKGADNAGDYLGPTFDKLWLWAGFEDGSPSYSGPRWAGYDA